MNFAKNSPQRCTLPSSGKSAQESLSTSTGCGEPSLERPQAKWQTPSKSPTAALKLTAQA
jgi:hypothetical protein